jgi:DNA-binding PadR family transcriptional regulator
MTSIGLWEIAVLALLREDSMHPYEMQRLLRERHTEELLPLKRGSLYHAIDRLAKDGLIEAAGTSREGRRPQRTTYRLAKGGEEELLRRLRQTIATPEPGSPVFMTCISFLVHLTPADARDHLEQRARLLEREITGYEQGLAHTSGRVARIHLVEIEFLLAMRKAELTWVRGLAEDIRARRLTWTLSRILADVRKARSTTEV